MLLNCIQSCECVRLIRGLVRGGQVRPRLASATVAGFVDRPGDTIDQDRVGPAHGATVVVWGVLLVVSEANRSTRRAVLSISGCG